MGGRGAASGASVSRPVVFTNTKWSRCSAGCLWRIVKLGEMAMRAPDCGQRSDSYRLWKMKSPMALELVQSAFACPYMPCSPNLQGQLI